MDDTTITLFLADDHQLIVEGLMALVADDPCIQVVGYCNNGMEVVDKVRAVKPDVLVLDISLPGLNGLDICRLVRKISPETAVLMLTMHSNERCVIEALENGALGYLVKEAVALEFCEAVHAVARGEVYLGQSIPIDILARINKTSPDPYSLLTDQERQVLQLFAEGKSNQQVGAMLGVPEKTVEEDYASLTRKLSIQSPVELVKYAIRRQMVPLG